MSSKSFLSVYARSPEINNNHRLDTPKKNKPKGLSQKRLKLKMIYKLQGLIKDNTLSPTKSEITSDLTTSEDASTSPSNSQKSDSFQEINETNESTSNSQFDSFKDNNLTDSKTLDESKSNKALSLSESNQFLEKKYDQELQVSNKNRSSSNSSSSEDSTFPKQMDTNNQPSNKALSSSSSLFTCQSLQTTLSPLDNKKESTSKIISSLSCIEKIDSPQTPNIKRNASWFSFMPTYRSRSEEFRKLFSSLVPNDDRLIVDFSCAYQREILAQGRVYISLSHVCFYANILTWETKLVIPFNEIKEIDKMTTAFFIPNAIQLTNFKGEKFFFTSFVAREKAYLMLHKVWQQVLSNESKATSALCDNCHKENVQSKNLNLEENLDSNSSWNGKLKNQKLNITTDVWTWIHEAYGDNLGFSVEEEANEKATLFFANKSESNENKLINCSLCSSKLAEEIGSFSCDSSTESDTFQESGDFGTPIRATDNESDVPSSAVTNKFLLEVDENKEELHLNEPTHCLCKQHKGIEIMHEKFALPVDQLFALLFDDSPFFRHFSMQRKTTNMKLTQWIDARSSDLKEAFGVSNGEGKQRSLSYVLQINHALAKRVNANEVQWMQPESKPGRVYMVRSQCRNSGIPYSDAFEVISQWCLKRGNGLKECELQVHAWVNFRKASWTIGLMKGMIEKSSIQGLEEHCGKLVEALHGWCRQKSLERRQNASYEFSLHSEPDDNLTSFSNLNNELSADPLSSPQTDDTEEEDLDNEANISEPMDADDEDKPQSDIFETLKVKQTTSEIDLKQNKRLRSSVLIERTRSVSSASGRQVMKWTKLMARQLMQQFLVQDQQNLIRFLVIVLIALAFLNVMLFVKLNQIEVALAEQESAHKGISPSILNSITDLPNVKEGELDAEARSTMTQLIQNWNLLIGKTRETFELIESNLTQLNRILNEDPISD